MQIGAQALIYLKERKRVLLVKRRDFPVWTLPGGQLLFNESPEAAIKREVFEETGVKIRIKEYLGHYIVWYFPPAGLTHLFICDKTGGRLRTSEETLEVKFWDINHLPFTLLPYIRQRIKDGLKS